MSIKDLMKLNGRMAIVTGGAGFLGSQMCSALLELGARVVSVSRGKSQAYTKELESNNNFISMKYDLSLKKAVHDCIDEIRSMSDSIDILVNNSYTWPKVVQFLDQDWKDFEQTMKTGIVAQLYITKLVFNIMIEQRKGGSIINIGSMYGKVSPDFGIYRDSGMGNAVEYGATKAGMIQITKYIASLGGKHNIRCNSISPGAFPRPGTFVGKEWFEGELKRKTMLNRVGGGEELKGAILLLATDLGAYITGADISVDGGWTAW